MHALGMTATGYCVMQLRFQQQSKGPHVLTCLQHSPLHMQSKLRCCQPSIIPAHRVGAHAMQCNAMQCDGLACQYQQSNWNPDVS